jgi:hypothetical protein
MLSSRSILDDNKCPVNNIKYSGPVEIHHIRKLGQLDKDVSQIDEIITMLNRKQISLCKLDHGKYFGLSLIERETQKRKRRKAKGHRSLIQHVDTDYGTRAKL